ncbi:chemotaxis protein CheD [Geobacter sp. OR-1]|uniref:chemotaxis protein CheD n=1 Tax=Geobacter sp. OR-1 TaxID=1266765 RepID=UPI00272EAF21|nr:chemotaxis protein CheD [Geobacter sp. OR-1]
MNHFMLSNRRYSSDLPIHISEAGRYGIHAMELLINDMLKRGAQRKYLKAKAFGGASFIKKTPGSDNFTCVGEANCRFIREFLSNDGIPLLSYDLGGDKGRVVHFSNGDFAVHVRKLDRQKSESLATRDHECWLRTIEMQEQTLLIPELWL